MGFNPGASGIGGASDVALNNIANNELLHYDTSVSKWRNIAQTSLPVAGDVSGTLANVQLAAGVVGTAEIADNAVTEPKLAVANSPTSGHVLSWNGTQFQWVARSGGSVGYADLPAGTMLTVFKSGATWPVRPTARTDIAVRWRGAAPGPTIGGSYAVDGVDDWDEV